MQFTTNNNIPTTTTINNHSPKQPHTHLPDRGTPKGSPEALDKRGPLKKLIRIITPVNRNTPTQLPTNKNTPPQNRKKNLE